MKGIFRVTLISMVGLISHTAIAEQNAYASPSEGGFYAEVGTFYAVTNSTNQPYAVVSSHPTPVIVSYYNDSDYDWGFEAMVGYAFKNTANSIEIFYRGFNTDDDASTGTTEGVRFSAPGWIQQIDAVEAVNDLHTEFNAMDLMFNQLLNIGNNMHMRFAAGLAYAEIEQKNHTDFIFPADSPTVYKQRSKSQYHGLGPRLTIDGRYHFGKGFGMLAGGSVAYFMGDLDSDSRLTDNPVGESQIILYEVEDNPDNHAVVNARGNIGFDYIYYFGNKKPTSIGIEVGYLADYYSDAINQMAVNETQEFNGSFDADLVAASFAGPYINLKGVY